MIRKAVLINASKGHPDPEMYLPGAEVDAKNYAAFLESEAGGAWDPKEIMTFHNEPRTPIERYLKIVCKSADYCVVAYFGHASFDPVTRVGAMELTPDEYISELDLNPETPRCLLHLDTCRWSGTLEEAVKYSKKAAAAMKPPDIRKTIRGCYEKEISNTLKGITTMYACSPEERANNTRTGEGLYTYNLIKLATEWANTPPDNPEHYYTLSVLGAHKLAAPVVTRLRSQQQPDFDAGRDGGPQLPFAIRYSPILTR